MIGWGRTSSSDEPQTQADESSEFDMSLGDIMRGERATLGKSLLDVQRELKIRASFVAAIENCDPSAFDTPGFIAGYVRSYARYLNMDPDWAFGAFCRESGFQTAHGMSEKASSPKHLAAKQRKAADAFGSTVPFTPEDDPFFTRIEPRALGSVAVLVALVAGLGYGGWSVLQEVQRVQFAPVDQAPVVASAIDPLSGAAIGGGDTFSRPTAEAIDRVYRPQALDLPVMTPRDAPIASINPSQTASADPEVTTPDSPLMAALESAIQVTEGPAPEVALLAVRPVWVRVQAADGAVIFEKILEPGEEYVVPSSEQPPVLRAGNSGSLFFRLAGEIYGPAGSGTATVKNIALGSDLLHEGYEVADLNADSALAEVVNVAQNAATE